MFSQGRDLHIRVWLKRLRERRGFSIRQLAQRAQIAPSTISRVETGELKPSLMLVLQLCDALQVQPYDFILLCCEEKSIEDIPAALPSTKLLQVPHLNGELVAALLRTARRLQSREI